MRYIATSLLFLILLSSCETEEKVQTEIQWQHSLTSATFEQAAKEGKLILLTLEANWCHWCHVMEDSTYSDLAVQQLLNDKFISVKVDQDANPELASRYRKYGWPATIVLNAKGEDLVKKAGYMNPVIYQQVLQDALDGKTEDASKQITENASSSSELKNRLIKNFDTYLDFQKGGFTSAMKYLEEESMDYALHFETPKADKKWFQKSIKAAYGLCDPAWGGVYQYSTQRDWEHAHYEKLLHIQARYIRLFLDDYNYYGNEASLKKAEEIKAYCDRFLKQSNGLFGNAQDADVEKGEKATDYFALSDENRVKRGTPLIDKNTYTNSNADYARSILKFYSLNASKKDSITYFSILDKLLKRKTQNGLYSHGSKTKETDALRDNLAMAQLFTEHLKRFPSDVKIKSAMDGLMKAIVVNFQLPNGTFQGFVGDLGLVPEPILEENIPLARVFNWYSSFSGNKEYKKYVQSIVTYTLKLDAAKHFYHEPGILMLLEEIDAEAQSHVSVNESKNHPLLVKAYVFAPFYSVFHILEDEPNSEKSEQFSGVDFTSLFICTSTFCSSPMRDKKAVELFYR